MQVEEELAALGVAADAVAGIVAATQAASLPELEALLGHGHEVRFSSPYSNMLVVPTSLHCWIRDFGEDPPSHLPAEPQSVALTAEDFACRICRLCSAAAVSIGA